MFFSYLGLTPAVKGGPFVSKSSLWPLPFLSPPCLPLPQVLCLFSTSSTPPLPKKPSYDPLIESSKPEKGSPFWRGSSELLLFLPSSPNPFWASPGGSGTSFNPFEVRVQEPTFDSGPGETELFL